MERPLDYPKTSFFQVGVSTFILDPVYKIYIGWFVPAKDPSCPELLNFATVQVNWGEVYLRS